MRLVDVAARLAGWRGPYLKYAFELTSTRFLPAEYRPHLDRVIDRRSRSPWTPECRHPDDPGGIARSKAIAQYLAMTERRRNRLGDYRLATAVHELLQAADVIVTARNAAGTLETLRAVDLREASIDIAANSLTIAGVSYAQIEIPNESLVLTGQESRRQPAHLQPGRYEASDLGIADWMRAEQKALKAKNERHGRDRLISLAAEKFGVKQAVPRHAWDWAGKAAKP